jgi:hypothetical protein
VPSTTVPLTAKFGIRYSAGRAVPIYGLFKSYAFEPEQLRIMGDAFEQSLTALGIDDRNDPLAKLVAMKIIELGQRGEHDQQRLIDYAVQAFMPKSA